MIATGIDDRFSVARRKRDGLETSAIFAFRIMDFSEIRHHEEQLGLEPVGWYAL